MKHPTVNGFAALKAGQKVNHFPGSWCLGRKDRLMRTIGGIRRSYGRLMAANDAKKPPSTPTNSGNSNSNTIPPPVHDPRPFDLVPDGWILPQEYDSWYRAATAPDQVCSVFILKPSASACGRGIRLIHKNNLTTVPKDKPCIIQRYLHDPYLINGKKFDLR